MKQTVHLGFEIGTGAPVEIPLAHTFVCGQTQQSGKTTTLQAIVARSSRKALAFVTKRGEDLVGRRIRPYLPRRSETPIHWRLVETMLASSLDQKRLQSIERLWLIKAAKGAYSLEDVQRNVRALLAKTKSDRSQDIYTLLDEYLELVVPQLRDLNASDTLDLEPALSVMDLTGLAAQTQAMVIRAALERINHHETDVLTVLPEAWEFAPRGRSAPAKSEAIALARKGAAPRVQNFLLVDSQDVAGVDNEIRQGCSVWLLGVQRELNEVKRALALMSAGVKRPKAADIATLGVGEFYACWGAHAVKVYVQPAWLDDEMARRVATGRVGVEQVAHQQRAIARDAERVARRFMGRTSSAKEDLVNAAEATAITNDNARLKSENAALRERLDALERGGAARPTGGELRERDRDAALSGRGPGAVAPGPSGPRQSRAFSADGPVDHEALYQAIKARLIDEAPGVLAKLGLTRSELEVTVTRKTVTLDEFSLKGRIARLLKDGFFAEPRSCSAVRTALKRTGPDANTANIGRVLDDFTRDGFVTDEGSGYGEVAGMTVRIVEA